MAVLNWKKHTLIQALMARGPLSENEFRKMFAELTGRNPDNHRRDFNDCLLKINKELSYVQMELRCCRNQNNGGVCYGLVNNVSDEQSKLGTRYSVPQIALFKAVIEAIVQDATAEGCISTIDALNLRLDSQVQIATGSESQGGASQVPAALRNFSMSQKEKTFQQLEQDGWLYNTLNGEIGLGVRSYLELRSWFHNSGIPSCEVCNEAGIKAKVCESEGCAIRIHHYCLEKKFSKSRGQILCPGCGTQWGSPVAKSEPIVEEDEPSGHRQVQSSEGSKRKRLRTNGNARAGTEGSELSQASQSVSQLRRSTRLSSRPR